MKIPRQQGKISKKYKSGAILVEMTIYTGESTTTSVRIEKDAELFRLDKKAWVRCLGSIHCRIAYSYWEVISAAAE